MTDTGTLLLILASSFTASIFIKWLFNFVRKCQTFPPGPWGLPLVGYAPWLGKKPYETFVEIGKKYGNVFSVTLGRETVVILNDWSSIKKTLVEQPKAFSGRPHIFIAKAFGFTKGIGFNEGPMWKTQRNLSIQILRNIGMGKKSMESKAMDIVHEILETLSAADGQILPMMSVIFGPILKVNWRLISGDDVEKCSVNLIDFEKILHEVFLFLQNNNILNSFPWLRFLPPNGFGFWKTKRLNDTLISYLQEIIDEHESKFSEGVLDDYVYYYLSEIRKRKSETETLEPPFNHEYLTMIMWSLFAGGVDTTNTTTLWGLLYLARHPHVQKKAQDELDDVIGRFRLPNMNDMANLPYLNALVMEINRCTNLLPTSIPHKTTVDTVIGNYKIPKGTTCLQNSYAVHHDPLLWDQPEVFKPERFIDQNNKVKTPPYLIPFSIGPRLCIGQSLAEMELRLIFSCVLHRFNLNIPPGQPAPSLEAVEGYTRKPIPYSLHVQKRND